MSRVSILILAIFWVITDPQAADAPAPVPVNKAAESIQLPDGFKATLFAGEPDLVQPIAMTTDTRGRLWVIECLSYPAWTTNKTGHDRVSIFEDSNADGRFDKKTVFYDKGRNLSGIALGFGGVWLCSLPELVFIPDRNADDKPDREPETILDGWDMKGQHTVFNSLTWGPDGWLYGCNGILSTSNIGKPGSAPSERTPMNCGVWKFHPTRRTFEVVAHGTTNPWGLAFDDKGQIFIANCVIKHLFHMIPGARYERMFGSDFNPYTFELIPSIADHIHWGGGYWNTEGADKTASDAAGGGHAHSGGMIYQGDAFPDEYRNTFFTINIHGHRLNNDTLERQGSGYVARHRPDFMRVKDTWFRGISVIPAHDGGIYVSDWSDADECHDYVDIHRENGRIFKIQYTHAPPRQRQYSDIRQLDDNELVSLQNAKDEWLAANARLVLHERADSLNLRIGTASRLKESFKRGSDPHNRLRALWALHQIGGTPSVWEDALADGDEFIRGWAVQLALQHLEPTTLSVGVERLAEMAREDESPFVRLYLASALQKLNFPQRLLVADGLVRHAEDATDHNLPLLIWYGIEPIVSAEEKTGAKLLRSAEIPLIRKFIAQRLALRLAFSELTQFLESDERPAAQADVINGMLAALNGRRQIDPPANWQAVAAKLKNHSSKETQDATLYLSLIFGDASAADTLKQRALNKELDSASRVAALDALIQSRPPSLDKALNDLLSDSTLRASALKGLAAYQNDATPNLILENYSKFRPEEKIEAINTLASRADYAVALLEAVRKGTLPARDITPFSARQMEAYHDSRLEPLLKNFGTVRGISGEKKAQVARYQKLLTPATLGQANIPRGRVLFQRVCASCHTLFDDGGKLAPELTGAQRSHLDYILENVIDPNAVVGNQYKATYFETSDDRLISGVVVTENESTVTIQTQIRTVTLPRADITTRTQSALSIMPEGLFETLDDQEIIDIVGYLQSPTQVPLPGN